MNKVKLF